MDLYLRKSDQGQLGPEIYRVILKDDGDEVEIGSISVQHAQCRLLSGRIKCSQHPVFLSERLCQCH